MQPKTIPPTPPAADYSGPSPDVLPPSPRRPSSATPNHTTASFSSSPKATSTSHAVRSPRLQSHPILLHPLPPSSALTKESVFASELELDKQTRQIRQERELREALQDQVWAIERANVRDEQGTWSKVQSPAGKGDGDTKGGDSWGESKRFMRPPQAFELYRAIDKHDIDFIMRVRDHSFNLLLQNNGTDFPIVYASRLGQGWRDVVILLVGALSRYVNHLEPEDFDKKETKNTLKSLRANLKLAIDHTLTHLPPGQTPMLLSSYLQVLIMSEGDSFLYKSISSISLLLRSYLTSSSSAAAAAAAKLSSPSVGSGEDDRIRPVSEAISIVRRFCTKELRGVKGGVGDVEEYIANAALDLVLMSAWSLAVEQMGPKTTAGDVIENLPTHNFARDLRTTTALSDSLQTYSAELGHVNPRLRRLLRDLVRLAGEAKKGVRGRLRDVVLLVDGDGDGENGGENGGVGVGV